MRMVAFFLLLTFAIVWTPIVVAHYRRHKDGDWHIHDRLGRGQIMRRWVNGEWQYRALNEEEVYDNRPSTAWD